jgi:iron complex outermembrane receptor protein
VELERQRDLRVQSKNQNGVSDEMGTGQYEYFSNIGMYLSGKMEWAHVLSFTPSLRYDGIQTASQPKTGGPKISSWNQRFSPSCQIAFQTDIAKIEANYASGFENPTLIELSNNPFGLQGLNQDLKPMNSHNFEMGVSTQYRNVDFAANGYFIKSQNEIIPFELPDQPGRTFYNNAGKTERMGIELSSQVKITSWLYLHTQYTNLKAIFQNEGPNLGNEIPGIPQSTAQASFKIFASDKLQFFIDNQYVSAVALNSENSSYSPKYTLHHIRTNYDFTFKNVLLQVNAQIQNVLDTAYYGNIRQNAAGGRYYEWGNGRQFYIGISMVL